MLDKSTSSESRSPQSSPTADLLSPTVLRESGGDTNCSLDGASGSSPAVLRSLNAEQQVQLSEILDDYLAKLERHEAPTHEELVAKHPDLADALTLYLNKLSDLHNLAGLPNTGELSGRLLGDFRLEREIGRGGMGIVFSAWQQTLDREVAVKLLPFAGLLDPKHVERFRNEARAAAQLEHPNIVPVYAIGEEGGIHFFAMRLISGQSLDQRIEQHRQAGSSAPTSSVLQQFADVADALHCAHEYGVVHRDIKPSNLLLETIASGSKEADQALHANSPTKLWQAVKLWVADFGLARIQSDKALTRTGEMIGTMRYMSPEQASGHAELVDHRTDIYSLGVTLYELLTLQPAVPGEEGPGLLKVIENHLPTRLRKLRPDCSRDLQTVIERAIAKHKDDRYASASDFADDLRRAARGVPVKARPLSRIQLGARYAVKHSRLLVAATAVLATWIVGLVISNLIIRQQRDFAKDNLRSAHQAVQDFGTDLVDQLAMVPGADAIRGDVIRKTLNYYESFIEQAQDDAGLWANLALAHTRMGSLNEELGQLDKAIENYRTAVDLYQKLDESNQAFATAKAYIDTLNHLGLVLDTTGLRSDAQSALGEALSRIEALADKQGSRETYPESLEVIRGRTLNNVGLLQIHAGEFSLATQSLASAQKILRTARETDTEDHEAARGLAAVLRNQAMLLMKTGETGAQQLLAESADLQRWIAEHAQNRIRASRDLVSTYLSLGEAAMLAGRPRDAMEPLENAVQISEQLVAISPNNDDYRQELAVGQSNWAMVLDAVGNSREAIPILLNAVQNYQKLVAARPESHPLAKSLAITLNNLGQAYHRSQQLAKAEKAYATALETWENATRGVSTTPTPDQESLSKLVTNYVQLLEETGKLGLSDEVRRRARALGSIPRR